MLTKPSDNPNDYDDPEQMAWHHALCKAMSETYEVPRTFDPNDEDDMTLARLVIHRTVGLLSPEMREYWTRTDPELNDEMSNESLFIAWYETPREEQAKVKWSYKD